VAKAGNTSHRQKWREPRLDSQIITSRTVRKGTCPSGSTNIRVASTPFHNLRQPKASISLSLIGGVRDLWSYFSWTPSTPLSLSRMGSPFLFADG
jgi:hypothetical protein